ncbi:hypothetical protein MAR_037022 [Mya arenaria]|uniref:EGF-like domain-containing protein n=1 Tax=Mya arenaria TaxID=6604 RepID=A0ABY7FMA5_MYAAR|nr:hypothetical protein MAR_037022 [Mya arenaria]
MSTFYTCENFTCPEKATCKQKDMFVYCDCPPGKTGAFGIPHCTTCLDGWIGDKCDQDENECTAYPDICENGADTNKDGESKKDETEDEIYENITPVDDSNEMQKTDTNKAEYHDHTDRTYTSDYYEVYTGGKRPDHSAYPIMPTFYTCENFTCPEKATCRQESFFVYCDCPPDKTGATGIPHCTTCLEGWIGDKCDQDENECTDRDSKKDETDDTMLYDEL